jgi:hypothetical protein
LRIAVDGQLSAIGHLAAPFWRARDHLSGFRFLAIDKSLILAAMHCGKL